MGSAQISCMPGKEQLTNSMVPESLPLIKLLLDFSKDTKNKENLVSFKKKKHN